MKCLRPRLRWRRIGWLAVPFVVWTLLIAVLPTEWARARLAKRLSEATGQPVRLGSLRVGFCGGLRLEELAIGSDDAPWFRAVRLRFDLNLMHLLFGLCEPSKVKAEGLVLRVHRRADGSCELTDLLWGPRPTGEASGSSEGGNEGCELDFRVTGGQIVVIDDRSKTQLELTRLEGRGSWSKDRAAIQELHAEVNGGKVHLAVQFERASGTPMFEGQLRAQGVTLDGGMVALGYLMPVLSQSPDALDGRLDLTLYLRGEGTTSARIRESLVGQGVLILDPVRLDKSRFLAEIDELVKLPDKTRVGSVQSRFTVGQGRVSTDQLKVNIAQIPILLTGWTDFDGHLNYQIPHDDLMGKLPAEARELLADTLDLDDLVNVRLQGTLGSPEITVDGVSMHGTEGGESSREETDRQRRRRLARRLRDRILR